MLYFLVCYHLSRVSEKGKKRGTVQESKGTFYFQLLFHLHFVNPLAGIKKKHQRNPKLQNLTIIIAGNWAKCFPSGTRQFFEHEHFTRYCQTHTLSEEIILFSQVPLTSLTAPRLAGSLCLWETKNQAPTSHDSIKIPTDIYLKLYMCHLYNYLKLILWEHWLQNFREPLENIFLHPSFGVNCCHLECHCNTAHLETEDHNVRVSVFSDSP